MFIVKFFKAVLRTVVFLAVLAFLAVAVGTIWHEIPYLGSIAGYLSVPYWHWFIITLFALTLLLLIIVGAKRKKKGFWRLAALMCAAAFCLHAYGYFTAVSALNKAGAEISLFSGFSTRDVSGVKIKEAVYTKGEEGDLYLDLYYTEGEESAKKPVYIYIHGGGWAAGDRKGHSYYSKVFAKNGYLAVSIDYDLSDGEHHYWNKTEDELCRALVWLSKNAEKYGADMNNVFVTGDSAGGHLTLELANKINGGVYRVCEGTELPKIRAISVSYPVASPADFYLNTDEFLERFTKPMVEYYTGTDPIESPALINTIEPVNYITAGTPPTMIFAGEADSTVVPDFTYTYASMLEKKGVETLLVKVPFANHAFDNVDGNFASEAYINLTMKWFDSHMK